ncbi:hypothetical protein AB0K18_42575 [Nonomuraea sp. NPDC049421]|uniref:hypothetical protein n=1 Tax=Nonomuraea sp. NPDC049421 TaxID=3155275 RepID=UPI00342118DC
MPDTDTRPALDELDFSAEAIAVAAFDATGQMRDAHHAAAWAATLGVRAHLSTDGFYAVHETITHVIASSTRDLAPGSTASFLTCAAAATTAATTVAEAHAHLDHGTETCADCGFHATERIIRDPGHLLDEAIARYIAHRNGRDDVADWGGHLAGDIATLAGGRWYVKRPGNAREGCYRSPAPDAPLDGMDGPLEYYLHAEPGDSPSLVRELVGLKVVHMIDRASTKLGITSELIELEDLLFRDDYTGQELLAARREHFPAAQGPKWVWVCPAHIR